ncbi:MAG: hypothetical protein D6698_11430 [Gammaproteobacteria bacterium]|nr:MAG: hypothetical protein D6698_11430 [Gammaproteobacteria bacterium]
MRKFMFDLGSNWGHLAVDIDDLLSISRVRIADNWQVEITCGDDVHRSLIIQDPVALEQEYKRMFGWANGVPPESDVEAAESQLKGIMGMSPVKEGEGAVARLRGLVEAIKIIPYENHPHARIVIEYDPHRGSAIVDMESNEKFDDAVNDLVGLDRVGGMTKEQKVIMFALDTLAEYSKTFTEPEDFVDEGKREKGDH